MSRRGWLVNAALAAGAAALTLLAAELAVRRFSPQPTGLFYQDRFGLGRHFPGLSTWLPQYGHEVSFNAAGMRDREHSLTPTSGTFRVLLLGDSFVEALQVPFEASLPSQLERALARQSGRAVEVVAAGVSGWGQDDELRYLTQYGLAYQPDLVVVAVTLHNDLSDNLRQEWHTLRGDTLVSQPKVPASFLRYKVIQLKSWLSTRFQLYQLWRRVWHSGEIGQARTQLTRHVVQVFQQPPPAPIAKSLALTGHLLGALRDTAGAHGARLALVLLPIRYQLSDSAFALFAASAGLTPAQLDAGRPQQAFTRMADSLGIPVTDLLPRFREWTQNGGEGLFLTTEGHWTATGHRVAAEAAAAGLAPLLAAPR